MIEKYKIEALSENEIEILEKMGANRWQKFDKDRLYLLNLDKYYLYGDDIVSYGTEQLCGSYFSNAEVGRTEARQESSFIDLKENTICFTFQTRHGDGGHCFDTGIKELLAKIKTNSFEELEKPIEKF